MRIQFVKQKGYTLIEILVVIGIMAIVMGGSTVLFLTVQANNERQVIINNVISILRKNQSLAMLGEGQNEFGVQFETNKYIEFVGDTYVEGAPNNVEHLLPAGVTINDVNLGGDSFIYFNRISGIPSNSGSFDIAVARTFPERTILINSLGTVNVE